MSSHPQHYHHKNDSYMTKSEYARRYSDSDQSEASHQSGSTAPTEYEYCIKQSGAPTYHTVEVLPDEEWIDDDDDDLHDYMPTNSKQSIDTYSSSVPSIHEAEYQEPDFQVPIYRSQTSYSDDITTTPADFAELFPSTRRLTVEHDDSALDGNMNLKVNTLIKDPHGRMQNMKLFHLRLYDLKNREFSFRRYCRESGREICHTALKHAEIVHEKRPSIQRSLSNAFAIFRTKSESTIPIIKRADSGDNASKPHFGTVDPQHNRPQSSGGLFKMKNQLPSNTIKLDFSNYSQVEMKCRGSQSSKRYDFQYWGQAYQWRRLVQRDGMGIHVSFHLYGAIDTTALAHIVPEPQDSFERYEEQMKGGWIPPCSMWISDERIWQTQHDVSDVVMATGLVSLVDDCIKREFQSKHPKVQSPPMSNLFLDADRSTGAKRMFSGTTSRPAPSHGTGSYRGTPLRQTSHST